MQSSASARTFEIRTKRAEHAADLFSRYADLMFCLNALRRLLALLSEQSKDAVAVQAFWASAVIYYGRCFGKGKLRTTAGTKALSDLVSGHDEMHESFMWRRDKEIAHAVESAFDEVVIGASMGRKKRGFFFEGVAVRNVRTFAPPKAQVEIIERHVDVLVQRLARMLKAEMESLQTEVDKAIAGQQKILGKDVSDMFSEGGAQQSDPLGMTLELADHDHIQDMRRRSDRAKKPDSRTDNPTHDRPSGESCL